MAAPFLIPVEQYLSTSYEPDCDYIDGEVHERNMGERPHSLFQMALAAIFSANRRAWNVLPMPEQRVQIIASRFRVPDFCLIAKDDPADLIVRVPPLLCVEILSSCQSVRDMQECTDDYLNMGVRQVWIFDPLRREAFAPDETGTLQPATDTLTVAGTPILLTWGEVLSEYDDLSAGR